MSFIETEKNWYPEGVERCSLGKFTGWLGGLGVIALIGFIAMRLPSPDQNRGARRSREARARRSWVQEYLDRPEDLALWEKLRAWRAETARQAGVPPYVVFHDRTLLDLVLRQPDDPDGLAAASGMSWARLAHFRGRPRQVVVQLTDRCNARCPQCGMNVTRGGARGDLDTEAARRIVDHCARLGVSALSFTGGEPLLAGDRLFDVLAYADRRGIAYLRTGTNGWSFARPDAPDFEARVTRLAANLVRSRVRNFWISLDSADSATHEAGRGLPGVVEGIGRALPILAAHGIYPTANLALNRFMKSKGISSRSS